MIFFIKIFFRWLAYIADNYSYYHQYQAYTGGNPSPYFKSTRLRAFDMLQGEFAEVGHFGESVKYLLLFTHAPYYTANTKDYKYPADYQKDVPVPLRHSKAKSLM